MKIVFIGAGNVATHLAKELYKYDFDILQVYSRTIESANALALQVNALSTCDIRNIIDDADLYLFSLKDAVLEEVITQMSPNNGLWVHTAGSMPMDVFKGYNSRYGVFYPFQTFSKDRKVEWNNIPIFIEATKPTDLDMLYTIGRQLSNKVSELSSEDRKYLHLTGVFVCNFTNHMYALSELFLKKINLPFDIVLPLIEETCAKVHTMNPNEAQTGPAIRYDENVINKHLSLIEDERIRSIYKLISESIYQSKNI